LWFCSRTDSTVDKQNFGVANSGRLSEVKRGLAQLVERLNGMAGKYPHLFRRELTSFS